MIKQIRSELKTIKNYKGVNEWIKGIKDEDFLKVIVASYIEEQTIDKKKFFVIDNIERLSSKNRLDIINKIMNWASISGVTYIFLTNFDKIKITKEFEEDFWNKISLQETFKLHNDWREYVKKYSHQDFVLADHPLLLEIVIETIPIFFQSGEDSADIREIKKILDNWTCKHTLTLEVEIVISFVKEIERNIYGLDKYFSVNKIITFLSKRDIYWDLFKNDMDKELEKESKIEYTPMINNKMFRIQSNFLWSLSYQRWCDY